MKKLIFFIMLFSSFAHANSVILGGFSKHLGALGEYNETHPAIGYALDNGLEFGAYHNSIEKTSLFIAKTETPWRFKGFNFGYRVGAASGYGGDNYVVEKDQRYPGKYEKYNSKGERIIPVEIMEYKGIMPQAQFLISKETKYITIDLGISTVSTLIFKVNL
jgi:hypothetical protein